MLNVSAARIETMTRTCNLAVPRPYGANHMTVNRYLKSREHAGGPESAFSAQFGLWIANAGTRDGLEVERAARPAMIMCCVRSCAVYDHVRGRSLDPSTRGPHFPSERADEMLDAGATVERHEDALSFAQVDVEDWLE